MVGKSQEIDDGGSKHPGNELVDYEVAWTWIWLGVIAEILFFVLLFFLGGANVIH